MIAFLLSRMVAAKKFSFMGTISVIVVVVVLKLSIVNCDTRNADTNPDIYLRTTELLNKYGYRTETHYTVTEDGYILEMHRIVGAFENGHYRSSWKDSVLLQHGLAGSSADWVIMGPRRSLAYLLADQGYDVWLGNSRGNLYSRNHTFLFPKDRAFWDFSWHELGVYDLPATIDYMLEETHRSKIFYVGHSQGTTQFWVMASERPTYNAKIILMAAFAPAAYTGNLRGPVTKLASLTHIGVATPIVLGSERQDTYRKVAQYLVRVNSSGCSFECNNGFQWVGENFGYPEYTPRSSWGNLVSTFLCRNASFTQFLCSTVIFLIAGFSPDELDSVNLPTIIGHIPAGASWKQFIHYGQGTMEQGYFRKYDYENDEKNLRNYNSRQPPEYPLEEIHAPVALFSSENDWLATPKDVALLELKLRTVILSYKVPMNTFNHYDFLWGRHAPQLVYQRLFQLLEEYAT